MDFIIVFIITISVYILISAYFSLKCIEVIKEFDKDSDKDLINEMLTQIGSKNPTDFDNETSKLTDKNSFWLIFFTIISISMSLFYALYVFINKPNYKHTMIGISFIFIWLILIFLDKWLDLGECRKLKDIDYRNKVAEKSKRLAPIRIFYMISSIIIIVIILIIQGLYDLKASNKDYYYISTSAIFIYLGAMGLISKIMFLKVPFKLDGKLQPYINTLILGVGLYILFNTLAHMFL